MKRLIKGAFATVGLDLRRAGHRPPENRLGPDPLAELRRLVTVAAPTIFDVGAFHGLVTREYRRLFPDARIVSFEPFPESFATLKETVAGDPRTTSVNMALADAPGKLTMNANSSPATNSLLSTSATARDTWGDQVETAGQVTVDVSTLDDYCTAQGVDRVDLLKLDTQGTETRVLAGARRMLESQRVGVVFAEAIVAPTYDGQAKLHELLALMDGHGFVLHGIYEPFYRDGRLAQMDVIFARP
jgi:FkbM family methyltransferase